MRLIVVWILLAFMAPALADVTVYKRVRPDGTVEFSDEPIKGGQAIQVPPVPTYSLPKPSKASPKSAKAAPKAEKKTTTAAEVSYKSVRITDPVSDGTVFFDEKGVPVTVSVGPALQKGHVVVIYLDGKQAARGASTSFTLKDVFRGSHTVTAAIVDGQGKALIKSAPSTFNVVQHTVH